MKTLSFLIALSLLLILPSGAAQAHDYSKKSYNHGRHYHDRDYAYKQHHRTCGHESHYKKHTRKKVAHHVKKHKQEHKYEHSAHQEHYKEQRQKEALAKLLAELFNL